jgi:hypothetical protein
MSHLLFCSCDVMMPNLQRGKSAADTKLVILPNIGTRGSGRILQLLNSHVQ